MQKIGFPCNTKNSKAIGYFTDEVHEITNAKGEKVSIPYVMLKHWIPGSSDYSSTPCKNNADGHKLRKEWSQAWAQYEKEKAAGAAAAPLVPTAVEYGIQGTPIEDLNFLGKDHLARLKAMGFTVAEQLADMSDTTCNNVGFGARDWRRKAAEHLIVARDQRGAKIEAAMIERASAPTPDVMAVMSKMQEDMAKLVEQLMAANAKIAEMEARALPQNSEGEEILSVKVPQRKRRKSSDEARAEA